MFNYYHLHLIVFHSGILNIFNPCKPEGGWQLDLMRWEERQVAKMLIHLSVVEPGENCKYFYIAFPFISCPVQCFVEYTEHNIFICHIFKCTPKLLFSRNINILLCIRRVRARVYL